MNQIPRIPLWVLAALALFVSAPAMAKDTLLFAAAPGDGAESADFYAPLTNLIAKASGKRVEVEIAPNYVEYARNMKAGKYDLVFDAPHFAGWRMARVGHVALVRLPGESRLVIATPPDGPKSLDELAEGRRICALASPQLSNLMLQQQFQNPARQPLVVSVRASKDLTECLGTKRAEAAAFPADLWDSIEKKDLRTFVLSAAATYPERTLTVTNQVDQETRGKISAALLSEEGAKSLGPFLKYYKAEKLLPADSKAYEGAASLLQQATGFQ